MQFRSARAIRAWRTLFTIWSFTSRPTHWNGAVYRHIPKDPESQNDSCSTKTYKQRFIQPRKAWHYTKALIGITSIILLPIGLWAFFFFIGIGYYYSISSDSYDFLLCMSYVWASLSPMLGVCITVYTTRIAPHLWSEDTNDELPFHGIVEALRERRATVAKDKAFAMSGVLTGLGILTSKPDYGKPLGKVYHELFLDLLRRKPALINLLLDVGPKLPGVPSWVPDWSSLHERCWIQSHYISDDRGLYGSSFPEPQMKIADDMLGLWSVRKGKLIFCSEQFAEVPGCSTFGNCDTVTELLPSLQSFGRWLQAIRQNICVTQLYTADALLQSVYEVLLGRSAYPLDMTKYGIFTKWSEIINASSIDDVIAANIIQRLRQAGCFEFHLQCCTALASKSGLFVTDDGYIGSGPPHMNEGDQLVLLRGVAAPMVLRHSGDDPLTYSVVGPAYVYALMDLSGLNGTNHGRDWEAIYLV